MAEVQVIMRMAVMYRGRSARDNKGLLAVAVLHVRKRGRDSTRHCTLTAQIYIRRVCSGVTVEIRNYADGIDVTPDDWKRRRRAVNLRLLRTVCDNFNSYR